MINITYKDLDNPAFQSALRKILAFPGFKNFALAFNGGKIATICEQHWKDKTRAFMQIAKKYAVLDESGEFVCHEDMPGTFIVPEEKAAAFEAESAAFGEREIEIDRPKFKPADLTEVGLTAQECAAIGKLVGYMDTEPYEVPLSILDQMEDVA